MVAGEGKRSKTGGIWFYLERGTCWKEGSDEDDEDEDELTRGLVGRSLIRSCCSSQLRGVSLAT